MIAGSQLRDTQGEMLDIEGADISDLIAGRGRFNDNHGKGFFNSIGRVTDAKKIFGPEDFSDPRHEYYWNKVKAPYIYVKGFLYNDEDHGNAKAAAAILRNIHKSDSPLKLKASVEGGVVARGLKDESLLARTKIHSVAITFTPANNATLVEPCNLQKSSGNQDDMVLIKSVMHLAKDDREIPSFKHIRRSISAHKIIDNMASIQDIIHENGLQKTIKLPNVDELIQASVEHKVEENLRKINELMKTLAAGYGGAAAPTSRTGGSVLQSESLDDGRSGGMKYFTCDNCGKEQIYMKHQVKCRSCGKHQSLEKLYGLIQ